MRAHKLGTVLLLLSMAIGVFSLISINFISQLATKIIHREMLSFGVNRVWIYRASADLHNALNPNPWTNDRQINMNAIQKLKLYCPGVKSLAPSIWQNANILYREKMLQQARIVGTVSAFEMIKGEQLWQGRFLSSLDEQQNNLVCVLSGESKNTLFPDEPALSKQIVINHDVFTIVGVLKPKNRPLLSMLGGAAGREETVFIPLSVMQGPNRCRSINIQYLDLQVENELQIQSTIKQLKNYFTLCFGSSANFKIKTHSGKIQRARKIMRTLSVAMGMIAVVVLAAAGLGITNMMFSAVSERCFEIGLRRAVGAKQFDILIQFLVEAMLIGLAGGLVGILAGIGVFYLAQFRIGQAELSLLPPIFQGFLVSLAVGLAAGIFPAWKAARLNPIEALRNT